MINGLNIFEFPFKKINFVGVLMFKEYPSTVIYSDVNKFPVIIEWVDFDEEKQKDVFFIYEIAHSHFKNYLEKSMSHYDLVMEAKNGIVTFFYGTVENPIEPKIVSCDNIPSDYLPSFGSYFNPNDTDDLEEINSYFDWENHPLTVYEPSENVIKYYSEKTKSELFHIHLKNGIRIGHGRAQTDVLGNTLLTFEDLYHEVASDHVRGKDRIRKIAPKERIEFDRISHTEVVLNVAASFSVYLRPISNEIHFNLYEDFGDSPMVAAGEKIFQNVLELINSTSETTNIDKVKDTYSHNVFVKLKKLAEHVVKNDLDIQLEYFSPVSERSWDFKLDISYADNIVTTLTNTSVKHAEKFKAKGKFTALNCKTGHCTFYSNDEEEYSGYFDDLIFETMPNLNFVELYQVTIERNQTKNIADEDFKFTDKIIAVDKVTKKRK